MKRRVVVEISAAAASAHALLELAREHKVICPGESCTVTLFPLGQVFEQLVDRKMSAQERKVFM